MAANILRRAQQLTSTKSPTLIAPLVPHLTFTTSPYRDLPPAIIDSDLISQITAFEKEHTKSDSPIAGGPTAIAQSQAGARINEAVIRSILDGERKITGSRKGPLKNGPAALARRAMQSAPDFRGEEKASGRLDSKTIARVTEKEKEITGQDDPVKGGPTAKAQSHAGEPITSQALHDITEGEKKVTGGERIKRGPTSAAQSELSKAINADAGASRPSGKLDSDTIAKVTEKEKGITGQDDPVRGGPTAKAQSHAGEPITSQALHDITEGEKKITGGERIKGGPTSSVQSELAKARASN